MADAWRLTDVLPLPPATHLQGQLVVPADHPVLAGHFPGAPLVPGVLLLTAVAEAHRRATGKTCELVAVDDVRFQAPLLPDVTARLHAACELDDTNGEVVVAGEWHGPAGRLAVFRVRLRLLA
jgi:3-hydroxymyristoyl/3-hydroxydecanoyl-(acyl carrier protein) dehydratase